MLQNRISVRASRAERFQPARLSRRRAIARRADEVIGRPTTVSRPSSYGMTDEQRSAYARDLASQGWEPWEIRARLKAPRRARGAA